mmetsp:Transcript_85933/g.179638  ORF Transcript_85933/g.179638 Transcript_85933/m.179638 type:complete len:266 (+) Transcript_85933:1947-2744(+)
MSSLTILARSSFAVVAADRCLRSARRLCSSDCRRWSMSSRFDSRRDSASRRLPLSSSCSSLSFPCALLRSSCSLNTAVWACCSWSCSCCSHSNSSLVGSLCTTATLCTPMGPSRTEAMPGTFSRPWAMDLAKVCEFPNFEAKVPPLQFGAAALTAASTWAEFRVKGSKVTCVGKTPACPQLTASAAMTCLSCVRTASCSIASCCMYSKLTLWTVKVRKTSPPRSCARLRCKARRSAVTRVSVCLCSSSDLAESDLSFLSSSTSLE